MRPLLAILLPLALAMPAAADCCDGYCNEMLRAGTPDGTPEHTQFYVAMDRGCMNCHPEFPLPWIYQESNGIPGLQRDDEFRDETCGGSFEGDTVLF